MLPFAIPYPAEAKTGFWGATTSTIDWCEENYVVSVYIAEYLNTTTNSLFIILAGYACYHAVRHHLEPRFVFSSLGFMLVGIGSWLFHMTLKYHFQLLDELPMIYATCIPFWSVFSEFKSPTKSRIIGFSIFFAANLLTVVYLNVKNPTLHQAAYGFLNFMIILKSWMLSNEYVADARSRAQLNRTMFAGLALFLFGYFLWNLDIHLCESVRHIRRQWGMPYGFILEGHGWWHIFTGLGVYYYLTYEEYLRCYLTKTEKFYDFRWHYGLPALYCIDEEGLFNFRKAQKQKKLE